MKQEVFCYIKGREHVHFLDIDGSLEAHDIVVDFICQISSLNKSTPEEVMRIVQSKLAERLVEDTLV